MSHLDEHHMQAPPPVDNLLQQLATMAANVRGSLADDDVDWKWRPRADEWSLTEVICHLRDVESEIHQVRFRALIATDNAFVSGAAPDEWASVRDYQRQDGPTSLAHFLNARHQTITLLEKLPPEMWLRQGRHAFFGPTSMHELLFLVNKHDEIHWNQIKTLIADRAAQTTSLPSP